MLLNKKYKVLLVEDDEIDVINIQRSFQKNSIKHELFFASDGQDALDKILGNNGAEIIPKPNIILLDINMPRMNGLEFLREIRKIPELHSIVVFILSTSGEEKDKMAAYEHNVAGYILKPISPDKFESAIKELNTFWELNEYP